MGLSAGRGEVPARSLLAEAALSRLTYTSRPSEWWSMRANGKHVTLAAFDPRPQRRVGKRRWMSRVSERVEPQTGASVHGAAGIERLATSLNGTSLLPAVVVTESAN
jgi:hypothetical protein